MTGLRIKIGAWRGKHMKVLLSLGVSLIASATVAATTTVQNITCVPSKDSGVKVQISFYKGIDPLHPFIGVYDFGATLRISQERSTRIYENSLRVTPETTYHDDKLRGDAEGVYLRLYPQKSNGEFSHYTGQLFINDLNVKAYYNFSNANGRPGLVCE